MTNPTFRPWGLVRVEVGKSNHLAFPVRSLAKHQGVQVALVVQDAVECLPVLFLGYGAFVEINVLAKQCRPFIEIRLAELGDSSVVCHFGRWLPISCSMREIARVQGTRERL